MEPKEYYRLYQADNTLSALSDELIDTIMKFKPAHALDFGCGSGKHSKILHDFGVSTIALDISMRNVMIAEAKHSLPCVICTDERYLRNIANCDIVFTCSVLDHIEDITTIIKEFKRIANKAIVIAETNDVPAELYFPHNYESYGFKKTYFEWTGNDGANYNIWIWKESSNDDLA